MAVERSDEFSAEYKRMAEVAKALGHPARIAIIELLMQKRSCICGELVNELPLAQATVSQHLKELKKAGLVIGEVEGVRTCYCLNDSAILEARASFGRLLDNNRQKDISQHQGNTENECATGTRCGSQECC